jgi:prohibitin 2
MQTLHCRRGALRRSAAVIAGVIVVAALILLNSSTVIIGAGERGVVYSKTGGVLQGTYGEGLHLVVPFVWEVIPYDVRSQTYTLGAFARPAELAGGEPLYATTSDGQQVILDLSLRYHLDPDQVWRIHQSIGQDYVVKIIKPQIRGDARIVVANYPGIEIFSKQRYALEQALFRRLSANLAPQSIIVEEVLVRNITFSEQFQRAIEQKQISQQDALRMDYVVKKQRQEKAQAIIVATGDAEAIRLKGRALASYPELVQWEYVNKLPTNVNVVVTDAQTIINLGELFKQPAAQRQGGQ